MDEVDALLKSNGRPLRDIRAAQHFLTRVKLTMAAQRREFAVLQRQVAQMAAESGHLGAPTTLDPASAMPFVDPAVLTEFVESSLRQKIKIVEELTREVLAARKLVMARTSSIRLAMLGIAEDETIDPDTKRKILAYLSATPSPEDLTEHPNDVINRIADGLSPTSEPAPTPTPTYPTPKPRTPPPRRPGPARFVVVDDQPDAAPVVKRRPPSRPAGEETLEGLFDV